MRLDRTIGIVVAASVASSFITAGIVSLVIQRQFLEQIPTPAPGTPYDSARETATAQEQAVVDVVAQASPAVVSIVAAKDLPVIERYFENPFVQDPLFEEFFGPFLGVPKERQRSTQRQQVAAGTGFITDAAGFIITNKHVVNIEGADFTVILLSGERHNAKVLAIDPVEDLAVLKIEAQGMPTISLGNSDAVQVGQSAIAIGNALGQFQNTVSVGVVSGLARRIIAGDQNGESEVIEGALQTDAAINEGNSGGPLLNLKGEAIGVNTAIVVGSQNIGFAIPIQKARRALESIKTSGKITYPFLGVRYVLVTQEIKEARGLSVDYGALVVGSEDGRQAGVQPDSPAAKAGIREGDVILEVAGQKVDAQHPLAQLIQQRNVGETITLEVLSGTKTKTIRTTLAERK